MFSSTPIHCYSQETGRGCRRDGSLRVCGCYVSHALIIMDIIIRIAVFATPQFAAIVRGVLLSSACPTPPVLYLILRVESSDIYGSSTAELGTGAGLLYGGATEPSQVNRGEKTCFYLDANLTLPFTSAHSRVQWIVGVGWCHHVA